MINHEKPNQQFEKRDQTYKIIDALLQQPELKEAMEKGNFLWQNKFHEFDVYDHSADYLKHIQQFTDDPNIIAAAYLHDIGKPMVAKPKIDKNTKQPVFKDAGQTMRSHDFGNHEKVGAAFIRNLNPEVFERINRTLSTEKIKINQETIAQLVNCHYLPMKGIKQLRQVIIDGGTFEQWVEQLKILSQNLDKPEEAPNISKEIILTMLLADKMAQGSAAPDKAELLAIREIMATDDLDPEAMKKAFEIQKENYQNKVWNN